MAHLNPFVRFNDGKCREAMHFYKECLGGGELSFMTLGESPMAKESPKEQHHLIMHSTLKKDNWTLIGSDMMRDKATLGDNVGLSLECESEKEINTIFNHLSKGGDVFMPVEEAFWGAFFGMVTDKYGVEWMLNCQIKEKQK